MLYRKQLDRRLEHVVTSSGGFVGHGHDSNNVVASVDKAAEAFNCKLGSSEKYYFQVFFGHSETFTSGMGFWLSICDSAKA